MHESRTQIRQLFMIKLTFAEDVCVFHDLPNDQKKKIHSIYFTPNYQKKKNDKEYIYPAQNPPTQLHLL